MINNEVIKNSDSDDIQEFDLKKNSRVKREGDRTGESDTETNMEIAQVETARSSNTKKRQLQLLVDAMAHFF